jgi:flavorubredoxin
LNLVPDLCISYEKEIEMIAPSSGVTWRTDPDAMLRTYLGGTERRPEKRTVVVYEIMLKGTPTVTRRALPAMAPLMSSVEALQLRNRLGAVFGSCG